MKNHLIRISFMILILINLSILISGCDNSKDPVQKDSVFKQIIVITDNPVQNEKLEVALFEKVETIEDNGNPYDYNYFKVMGTLIAPSGKEVTLPAFWYQDTMINFNENYTISPSGISGVASTSVDEPQGLEVVSAKGTPHYRFRFMPQESGNYTLKIKVYKFGTLIDETLKEINVHNNSKSNKGFITIDSTNNHNFAFENGDSFIPVGQNTCWYTSSTRQSRDFDVWFKKMNENNMNFTRIWMATWGFAIHWGKSYNNYSTRFSALARLDRVVDLAKENDIYFMLALNNHGQFSSNVNAEWSKNPYNKVNGGILDNPIDFFRDNLAKENYKNELLYLIARYSYSDNLMCYELFNEVDWIDNATFGALDIKNWHNEMALFIKENDPYNHLVSTSYKGETGLSYSLDSIDFVNPHSYGYSGKNINKVLSNTLINLYDKYKKPILQSEIGLNADNGAKNYSQDPNGISLIQNVWAGMMSSSGAAMNWWWDSYIHPNDLYHLYKGAGIFASNMNLNGNYQLLSNLEGTSINNDFLSMMGYYYNNRVYGYVYDNTWTYLNYDGIVNKNNIQIMIPSIGKYQVTYYDIESGEILKTEVVSSNVNKLVLNLPTFRYGIGFSYSEIKN